MICLLAQYRRLSNLRDLFARSHGPRFSKYGLGLRLGSSGSGPDRYVIRRWIDKLRLLPLSAAVGILTLVIIWHYQALP